MHFVSCLVHRELYADVQPYRSGCVALVGKKLLAVTLAEAPVYAGNNVITLHEPSPSEIAKVVSVPDALRVGFCVGPSACLRAFPSSGPRSPKCACLSTALGACCEQMEESLEELRRVLAAEDAGTTSPATEVI